MALINMVHDDRKCSEGLLHDYCMYTSNQESPEDFHLWVCLSLIGSAVSRKVWLNRGHYKIYPNLYTVLIAESANLHKSTAIKIGMRLLREALPEELNVFSQKMTPESLIKFLSEIYEKTTFSNGTIEASEFSVFLGNVKKDQSLVQLLTDLYDCPDYWDYTTIGRGKNVCNNVCLNLIGGSTVEWMKSSLPEDSMGGGFFSRLVPVYRIEAGRKVAHPEDVIYSHGGLLKDNIISDLKTISKVNGPFTWQPKAKGMFTDWYMDLNKPEDATPQLRGYYGRKGDTLIKLAMLSALSYESTKIITDKDFMFALNTMNANELFMTQLTAVMGQTDEGGRIDKILYYIKKAGVEGVQHSRLQRMISHQMNSMTMRTCIETLLDSRVIQKKGGTSPVYFYTGGTK